MFKVCLDSFCIVAVAVIVPVVCMADSVQVLVPVRPRLLPTAVTVPDAVVETSVFPFLSTLAVPLPLFLRMALVKETGPVLVILVVAVPVVLVEIEPTSVKTTSPLTSLFTVYSARVWDSALVSVSIMTYRFAAIVAP